MLTEVAVIDLTPTGEKHRWLVVNTESGGWAPARSALRGTPNKSGLHTQKRGNQVDAVNSFYMRSGSAVLLHRNLRGGRGCRWVQT